MSFTVRPMRLADASFVGEVYSIPDVRHTAVLHEADTSEEGIRTMVQGWLTDCSQLHFVVEEEAGNPLGISQLFAIDRVEGSCEMGVMILPDAQGKGLLRHIHAHQVEVVRDVLGLSTLRAQTVAYNSHFRHVSEKLGLRLQSVRRRAVYRDDEFHDVLVYEKHLV